MGRSMLRLVLLMLPVLCAGVALAQQGQVSLDHVDGLNPQGKLVVGQQIKFHIRLTNDAGDWVPGGTNGFRVYSPDEDASWQPIWWDSTSPLFEYYWQSPPGVWATRSLNYWDLIFKIAPYGIDGQGADTVGFGGASQYMEGLPPDWDTVCYVINTMVGTDMYRKTLCIDSTWYPPANPWKWVNSSAGSLYPSWTGPHCYEVFDPSDTLVALIVTPDSLHFDGVQGEANPPSQTFRIETDGNQVTYNLTETIDWIQATPIVGQTPKTVNVACNTVGLAAGEYIDSMMIASGGAENSPQYVMVTLTLIPPPPTIGYSPSAFYFNAVAGEANPPSQTLSIFNTGGGELEWTVANDESWLWPDPASGYGDASVAINVDITGLPFGQYYDTLVISDPEATNNPRRVPVVLTVASDLPVIQVDSAYNTIIVDVPSNDIPPRTIKIRNGGGGAMSYWLEENSVRIWSFIPESGEVPEDVVVDFKLAGGSAGEDYYDTLWVYSNEAINSPFPVVFFLHYVAEPAVITVSKDTVHFYSYECSMGLDGPPPPQSFMVNNVGGDNPMPVRLLYETTMFYLSQDTATAPHLFSINADYNLELPLGVYYDTILASAWNAINAPETLIVALHRVEGTQTPFMSVPFTSYTFYTQYGSGPEPYQRMFVRNQHAGCMPWDIQNEAFWVHPTPDEGDVPALISLSVNSDGCPFGTFVDTFQVVAPTASNSPKDVVVRMLVWLFHGDCNWDGQIDIADLVYLVDYMFKDGPEPLPEFVVGDMDCDLDIDIDDLVYFVNYMFKDGPIPCGNPY